MALVGLLGSVIGWPVVMLTPALWMLFPVTFFQSGITGFIWATTGAMAAGFVQEHEQGQLAGVNVALAGLMSMLGPLWAGAVYDKVSPNAPLWMGSIILVLACLLLARVQVKTRPQISSQVNTFSTAD